MDFNFYHTGIGGLILCTIELLAGLTQRLTPSLGNVLYAATQNSLHSGEDGIWCQLAY